MARLFLLLAGVWLTLGLAPAQEATPKPTPSVEVSPETHKVQVTSGQERVMAEFKVTNHFDKEVKIAEVIPSCECLDVYMISNKIAAGGVMYVRVELDMANRAVPQSRYVSLMLEGVPQEEVMLRLLVEAKE